MAMTEADAALVHGTTRRLDRASWGALFAGFFVGVGALFLLLTLGAGIGLTSVDVRDPSSWKAMGIGAGIWGGISAIIASFCSAWVASRLSTAPDRTGGMLHGVALWGLTLFVGLWMGAAAVGGMARAAGGAAQAAAQSPQVQQQAQQQAGQLQQQAGQAMNDLQQNAGQVGEQAAGVGKAGAWGAFLVALFTLLASGLGGAAGIPARGRAATARVAVPDTRPLEPAPRRT